MNSENKEGEGVKPNQFPVSLEEGLGVTPLTYLIPTQDCKLFLENCFLETHY